MRSEDVLNEQFRATKYSVGYDQREVDSFLDRVIDTLRHYEAGDGDAAPLTAKSVETVQFAPTRYCVGYEPHDVDVLLDRLAAAVADYEQGAQH